MDDVREWRDIPEIMCSLGEIYGILAAPPCTMFSLARTRAKTPRDFREGMECVKACMEVIWAARTHPNYRKDGALKFWALENPVGFLRQFLGMPAMTFDPHYYGDLYTKKTDLWGYFNKPIRTHQLTYKLKSISDYTGSGQADKRAITPAGFAKAFFKANK